MSTNQKLIGCIFIVALSGCASEFEQNKRKAYERLAPPCSYDEFVYAIPLVGCENVLFSPDRYVPSEKPDPNDPRPVPVPPVV